MAPGTAISCGRPGERSRCPRQGTPLRSSGSGGGNATRTRRPARAAARGLSAETGLAAARALPRLQPPAGRRSLPGGRRARAPRLRRRGGVMRQPCDRSVSAQEKSSLGQESALRAITQETGRAYKTLGEEKKAYSPSLPSVKQQGEREGVKKALETLHGIK